MVPPTKSGKVKARLQVGLKNSVAAMTETQPKSRVPCHDFLMLKNSAFLQLTQALGPPTRDTQALLGQMEN